MSNNNRQFMKLYDKVMRDFVKFLGYVSFNLYSTYGYPEEYFEDIINERSTDFDSEKCKDIKRSLFYYFIGVNLYGLDIVTKSTIVKISNREFRSDYEKSTY